MKSMWLVAGAAVALAACGGSDLLKADDGDAGGPDATPVEPCASNAECQTETAPICQLPEEFCRGCESESDCGAFPATPLCAGDGACVACRDSADCPDPHASVCDVDTRTCRACSADNDCASGVCDLAEGLCIDASMTYVVDDDAACATGDGSEAHPFCNLDEALAAFYAAPRNWVVFRAGDYLFPPLTSTPLPNLVTPEAARIGAVQPGEDCVRMAANAGLLLRGFVFDGCATAVRIEAPSRQVQLRRLTIRGGTTGIHCAAERCLVDEITSEDSETGLLCTGGTRCIVRDVKTRGGSVGIAADDATLELAGAQVVDAAGTGLKLDGSEVLVEDSTVSGGGENAGVACTASFCELERVRVWGAHGPGLVIDASQFGIRASAFYDNGNLEAPSGGVIIRAPGTSRVFEGNTVAGNRAPEGSVAGVACGATVDLHNSLVWGNQGLAVDNKCSASYSNLDVAMVGEGNVSVDPLLVSLTPGAMDVHLQPGSPCIDAGDPDGGAAMDFERQSRPAGRRIDIGADELGR